MKEGFAKGVQEELRNRQDATSGYLLSALILNNDNVVGAIRRELRRMWMSWLRMTRFSKYFAVT